MNRTIKDRASRAVNYIRAFGLLHGLRLLFAVERTLPRKSAVDRPYNLPGYPAPVWLRESVADHAIFWQVLVQREYRLAGFPHAERLMEKYRRLVAAGSRPLVIDCGGNIGLSAVWLARQFPGADVYVVEPEDANFAQLTKNTAAYANIHPVKGGIWYESGHLKIENPDAGSAAFRVGMVETAEEGALPAHSIPDIMARAGAGEILVLKVDIEGAQQHLFARNTDWVGKTDLIMMELDDWLYPWQGTSQAFFRCLSAYPFEYLVRGENIVCFQNRPGEA